MPQQNEAIRRIDEEFAWQEIDGKRFVVSASTLLASIFSEDIRIEVSDSEGTREYFTPETVVFKTAQTLTKVSLYFDTSRDRSNVRIVLDYRDRSLSVWGRVSDPLTSRLPDAIRELATTFDLVNKKAGEMNIERSYSLKEPFSEPEEILRRTNDTSTMFPGSPDFYANIEFRNKERQSFRRNREQFAELIRRDPDGLRFASISLRDSFLHISLRWEISKSEFLIEVGSSAPDIVQSTLQSLEHKWGLQVVAELDHVSPKVGDMRNYYGPAEGMTAAWLKRLLQTVRRNLAEEQWFEGHITRIGAGSRAASHLIRTGDTAQLPSQVNYSNSEEWLDTFTTITGDVERSSFYFSAGGNQVDFRADHQRQQIELGIRATTLDEVDSLHASLAKDLNLEPAPAKPATRAISSACFEITKPFSNVDFRSAVSTAIQQAVGEQPALIEASVIRGETDQDTQWFLDLDSLYERLEAQAKYKEVHVHVEGPRLSGLGIHLEQDRSVLILRSSRKIEGFRDLADIFENLLSLRRKGKIEEADTESKEEVSWLKHLLIPAALVVVGAIFATSDTIPLVPAYSVRLTNPTSSESGTRVLPPGPKDIAWVVTRRWFWWPNSEVDQTAFVSMVRNSEKIQALGEKAAPFEFDFIPGTYELEVRLPNRGVHAQVEFQIKSP